MDLVRFAEVRIRVSAPVAVCEDDAFDEKVDDLVDETRLLWERGLEGFPGVEMEVEL